MDFLFKLSEKVNPFQSIIVLSIAILILSFFAVSKNKAIKKYLIALASVSLLIAFLLNIHSYVLSGNFSNFLIFFGNVQMLEIGIIIFSAMNVLFFISVYRETEDSFVKELILFIFLVICAEFIIISKNFLLMFTALSIFILTIFQLVSIVNSNVDKIVMHVLRFFLRPTLTVIFFFFGFSLLYGATDFKDFNQILESEYISNPIVVLSLIILGIALYLYFFLFPLQGPYMKMIKRNSLAANAVIWFFYFPVGIFLFLKLGSLYGYFIEKNSVYLYSILIIVTCGCMLAGNIGAISTKSLRRITSFLFLFFISTFLFNISIYSTGIISVYSMNLFNFINIFLILFSFMPLYSIFSSVEKNTGEDNIRNIRGLGRNNIYAGVNMAVMLLSWLGLIYYLEPFMKFFNRTDFLNMGAINIVILIVFVICFIFLFINILRIFISIFRRATGETSNKVLFPKFLYVYITFFSIVIIITSVMILLRKLGVDIAFMNFSVTEFIF